MIDQAKMMKLNGRQAQVCLAVAEGGNTPEIGKRLGITSGTVRNHLADIYKVLGINSRAQIGVMVGRNETFLKGVAMHAKPAATRKDA